MTKPIVILGISCDYHDSAAALICDGEIIFAAHEERFSRKKHDAEFPRETIKRALREAKIDASQIDAVAYYEKPLLKFFDRIIPTFIKVWPRGFLQFHLAMQDWIHKKLWIKDRIHKELGCKAPVYFTQHH
jgi:carbamoyltransferase